MVADAEGGFNVIKNLAKIIIFMVLGLVVIWPVAWKKGYMEGLQCVELNLADDFPDKMLKSLWFCVSSSNEIEVMADGSYLTELDSCPIMIRCSDPLTESGKGLLRVLVIRAKLSRADAPRLHEIQEIWNASNNFTRLYRDDEDFYYLRSVMPLEAGISRAQWKNVFFRFHNEFIDLQKVIKQD